MNRAAIEKGRGALWACFGKLFGTTPWIQDLYIANLSLKRSQWQQTGNSLSHWLHPTYLKLIELSLEKFLHQELKFMDSADLKLIARSRKHWRYEFHLTKKRFLNLQKFQPTSFKINKGGGSLATASSMAARSLQLTVETSRKFQCWPEHSLFLTENIHVSI